MPDVLQVKKYIQWLFYLKEEGLYDRTQIYATDFNKTVLQKAKEGIYDIDDIKEYTYNYQRAGGKASFSDYYVAQYESVIFELIT